MVGFAVLGGSMNHAYGQQAESFPEMRNPIMWPFAWDSIWNLPIGDGAAYTPAGIQPATNFGMTVDEDILILTPDAQRTAILEHDAGWNGNRLRCESVVSPVRVLMQDVPIPESFVTDPGYLGVTPNMSAALLMADGVTVRQTQPLHRCADGRVVSQFVFPDVHLRTGDGIPGAHGGSGMSSLGGTLRVGELVPGGVIRHALKINLYARKNLRYDASDATPGYRWPALRADGYAGDPGNGCRYGGTNPSLEMGALLALRHDFDTTALQTAPGRIIAQALIDYGDDTCWDVYALATEWGPAGRVVDEFEAVWGFPMGTAQSGDCTSPTPECQWANDMRALFTALHVVDNNAPDQIGGGGERRQPCAPPFADGTGAPPVACNATNTSAAREDATAPPNHTLSIDLFPHPTPAAQPATLRYQLGHAQDLTIMLYDLLAPPSQSLSRNTNSGSVKEVRLAAVDYSAR